MSNPHKWSICDLKTTEGETMIVGGSGQEFGLIATVTDEADAKQIIADREARAYAPEAPDHGVLQDDLREMLRALNMNDGAQPRSPHEVFQDALAVMKRRLATADKDEDEAYEIGKRDGYESAIQELDMATGGDGEFVGSTIPENNVDVPAMRARIIERFDAAPPPQFAAITDEPFTVDDAWQEILDKDDRNSPEEYPEMVMLTYDEFRDYMRRAATTSPEPPFDLAAFQKEAATWETVESEQSTSPEIPNNSNCSKSSNGSPELDAVKELERVLREVRRALDPALDPTALPFPTLLVQVNRALQISDNARVLARNDRGSPDNG